MKFEIVTIFPDFFRGPLDYGIVRRARDAGLIEIGVHDLRAFTHDRHRTVDDRPFGGGEGMVLKPEPIFECLQSLAVSSRDERLKDDAQETVILLSPQGELFTQSVAQRMMTVNRVVLICGRYEGVDERVSDFLADREISDWRLRSQRRRARCGVDRGCHDAAGSRRAGQCGVVAAGVIYGRELRSAAQSGGRAAEFNLRIRRAAGLSALHAAGGFCRDEGAGCAGQWEP